MRKTKKQIKKEENKVKKLKIEVRRREQEKLNGKLPKWMGITEKEYRERKKARAELKEKGKQKIQHA